jgi:hypothetical protein
MQSHLHQKITKWRRKRCLESSLSQYKATPIQQLATHIPYLSGPRRSRLVHQGAFLCAASIGQDGTNTGCVAWASSKIRKFLSLYQSILFCHTWISEGVLGESSFKSCRQQSSCTFSCTFFCAKSCPGDEIHPRTAAVRTVDHQRKPQSKPRRLELASTTGPIFRR